MSNYKAELTHPTDSTGAAARPAFAEWNGGRHALRASAHRLAQFWPLTKPRITQMTVFCAVIGSLLACDGAPDWRVLAWSAVGIWLLAGAAFAVNCLLEAAVDARMARTARRASARGDLNRAQTVALSATMGASGAAVLWTQVNPLTMWLTLATFAGYAFVYTLLLKPYTSQNIVIGGLAGAMPPALGWAAVMNTVPIQAWLLVLIIFLWTPPHFWALAMYRRDDYARSGLPMLPVTHGMAHTGRAVWRYSTALAGACILPWAIGASGALYLASAAALNAVFLRHAWKLHKHYTDQSARKAFAWSILYLALLFVALLADHYWR